MDDRMTLKTTFEQRGHHLRQAGDRHLGVRMARPQHAAGVDVEQQRAPRRSRTTIRKGSKERRPRRQPFGSGGNVPRKMKFARTLLGISAMTLTVP